MDRFTLVGEGTGGAADAVSPVAMADMPAGTGVRYFAPMPSLGLAVTGYNAYGAIASDPRVDRFLPAPAMICVGVDAAPLTVEVGRQRFGPITAPSIYGPTTRPMRITTQGGVMIGIGVSPVGWARLGLGAAIDMQNRVVPVATSLSRSLADALFHRLAATATVAEIAPTLDAILAPLLTTPHPDEASIIGLARIIATDGDPDIVTVAAMLDLPPLRLRRLAMRHFGMTPKLLLRRARFLRSFLRDNGLDGMGRQGQIDPSYFDRPHYLRDAATFLGTTPRRFLAESNVFLIGSIRARAAVLGAPTQALHRAEPPVA